MIPVVQIKKPRLREVKGLMLAYWLVSVAARFYWTKGQAVSPILTAVFTLLTHIPTHSQKLTQRSISLPLIW